VNVFNIGGSRSMVAGVAVSVASVVVPVALGTGADQAKVDLLDGAAWLSSEAAGNVVRINAETGRVDARLELGVLAGELLVAQDDDAVLVQFGDQVRSIDLANLDWSAATDASGGLVVGDGAAYLVSPEGVVREVDPSTLETLAEHDLEARPGQGVVVDGRLVLPLDDGTVRVVDGDEVTAVVEAGDPGDALHVTLVGDTIAIFNQSGRTVQTLDAGDGETGHVHEVDMPRGEILVPRELPAGPLWVMATRSGELVGIGLRAGRAVTAVVADGRHQLTAPAVVGGQVYLVDRTSGEIVQVDIESLEVVRTVPLRVDDASRVELVVEGGKVFVNDPASSMAIVIDGDEYTRVDKYRDDGVNAEDTPASDVPNLDPPATGTPNPPPSAGGPAAPTDAATPPPPPPSPPPAPPAGPPAAPTSVTAVPGDESATVSWAPGGGPHPATAYHVAYPGGRTIDIPAGQLSVAVGGLSNGDSYAFEVWASNDQGESEHVTSNEVVPNDEVPGAPGDVRAVDDNASATVTWSEADGRGNDIVSYVVTPSPAARPPVRVDGNQTEATVTGLANGTTYTFTVTAINDLDTQSDPSAASNPVTPYGPPTAIAGLVRSEGDGSVQLSWQPAQSPRPVTYTITANPAVNIAPTTDTSAAISGLTNGVTYTFTIVPTNDRGAGPGATVQATPSRQPTIKNVVANRTGDRTFQVTFAVDSGGRPVDSCSVTFGGGGSVACDASSGTGSASLQVPLYDSDYTFTVNVGNSLGAATPAQASGRSAAKPLVVESAVLRWDGACWPSSRDGQRPYYRTPAHNSCSGVIGWLGNGTTARAVCHTAGEQIQDDYENQSNQWVRLDNGGYMSTLYFQNYTNTQAVIDGLRAC
jgi:Fibronectin type III domain